MSGVERRIPNNFRKPKAVAFVFSEQQTTSKNLPCTRLWQLNNLTY